MKTLPCVAAALLVAVFAATATAQQEPPIEGDEAKLIAIIESDADTFEKAKACQALAFKGTKQAVPALAALLPDEKLSHYARYGLEPIEDPTVDEALRKELGELDGDLLVGVINSIAVRRDEGAVDQLVELAKRDDEKISGAAISALGRIASGNAVAALDELAQGRQPVVGAAMLTAASELSSDEQDKAIAIYKGVRSGDYPEHQQMAAIRGEARIAGDDGIELLKEQLRSDELFRFQAALAGLREVKADKATDALLAYFDSLPADRQALVIYALGDLGQRSALPKVLEVAQSGPANVRKAAITVLADLGDANAVPVLLEATAGEGEIAEAARKSLIEVEGEEVDRALLETLAQAEGSRRVLVIEVAGQRGMVAAVPVLLEAADGQSDQVRLAAIKSLGLTVGLDQFPALLDHLSDPKSEDSATAAKEALRKACLRMPDRDACAALILSEIEESPESVESDLMGLLGYVGGERALAGVATAARSEDESSQDAATRVLGEWLTADAAPVLLDLAKTLESGRFRIRALRGYIRIARQLDVPLDERIAMCRKTIEAAERPDETRLALEVLERYPTAQGLNLAVDQLEDSTIAKEAGTTAVGIARKLIKKQPGAVAKAMETVAQKADDPMTVRQARNLMNRAKP